MKVFITRNGVKARARRATPFALSAHRFLWDWISKDPTRRGISTWPGWSHNGGSWIFFGNVHPACISTLIVRQIKRGMTARPVCTHCPLDMEYKCANKNSLRYKFNLEVYNLRCMNADTSLDDTEAKRLAEAIRDLPVRMNIPVY